MADFEVRPALRFKPFEVDFRARQLLKHGLRVKLSGQPFEILAMLLSRPGTVVTREQLRAKLWPADTFVDFDHSLNAAMNKLREALGDSAEKPRFVETLPRCGYRFVAPVDECLPQDVPVGAERQPAPPSAVVVPSLRLRAAVVSLVIFLAVSVGTYIGWRRFHHPTTTHAGKIMLAVLPFENLTGDASKDYISDGFTEEMITQLGGMHPERLGVIARTSAMTYKSTSKNTTQIGRELGVDYILEGSLRRAGDRVRISAQLIQVKDQTHLWAQDYDRDLRDLLSLQGEVAEAIAREIRIELTPRQQVRLARKVSPETYNLYLKGRYFWNKRTEEGFRRAIGYFQQAIGQQPDFAEAYDGLADSYLLLGGYRFVMQNESIPKARAAAKSALELDSSLADAHATLGLIAENYDWNWAEAERQYREAIALNPGYATAHHWYGEYLALIGRFDESLVEIKEAERLDPLSVIISNDHGGILLLRRQYDQAIAQLRKTLEMDPNFYPANGALLEAELQKGAVAPRSLVELKRLQAAGAPPECTGILAYAYARIGRRAEAEKELQRLKQIAEMRYVDSAAMVLAYIGLGDKEQAFAWLEREYAEHSTGVTGMKVHPVYDPLRSDPRFADLLRRLRFPP